MSKIVIVGSSNTDMVLKTARFPKPGETIIGGDFFVFQGGKGANQAVAAARLGSNVAFICKLGNDEFGKSAIQYYRNEGIDVRGVFVDNTASTGVAVITVNEDGENSIVVASGANNHLNVEDLQNAHGIMESSDWILTQLEIPVATIEYLAGYAREYRKKLILNPAPATTLPSTVYEGLFLITPNETETELLTGVAIANEDSLKQAVNIFKNRGVHNVIITLGNRGAYVDCEEFSGYVDSFKVKSVDTTAAGDVFNGALLDALSKNQSWKDALSFASKAAAISVTKMGAQPSAPTMREINNFVM